jgi:hypothetical protein
LSAGLQCGSVAHPQVRKFQMSAMHTATGARGQAKAAPLRGTTSGLRERTADGLRRDAVLLGELTGQRVARGVRVLRHEDRHGRLLTEHCALGGATFGTQVRVVLLRPLGTTATRGGGGGGTGSSGRRAF